MSHIIDRRGTFDKQKNIGNRKRFLDRMKEQVKQNVDANISRGKLKDLASGDKVRVKVKDSKEPHFQQDPETGVSDTVIPGNKDFIKGDTIAKPKQEGGGKGKKGGLGEDSEDDIEFTLTKDEFFDILFEDMELPDLVKKDIRGSNTFQYSRQGFTNSGNPSNIDILRSSKNALGRRIALNRPSKKKIEELEKRLHELENPEITWNCFEEDKKEAAEIAKLKDQIAKLKAKRANIPYLDPLDVRYKRFDKTPKPITNAVMFCLMDVSGSMGEFEKDIAKRFFLLLYLFLVKKYEKVDIVFVRHTENADEVDEHTFFYDKKSGGTKVSSGLVLINDIIDERYDLEKTNIYISQASDGDNFYNDNDTCYEVIMDKILPKIQYFAYIQISDDRRSNYGSYGMEDYGESLWDVYKRIEKVSPIFKSRRINHQKEIFDVLRDLFAKKVDR